MALVTTGAIIVPDLSYRNVSVQADLAVFREAATNKLRPTANDGQVPGSAPAEVASCGGTFFSARSGISKRSLISRRVLAQVAGSLALAPTLVR